MLDMFCGEEDVGAVDRPRRLRMEEGIWSMVVVMEVIIITEGAGGEKKLNEVIFYQVVQVRKDGENSYE